MAVTDKIKIIIEGKDETKGAFGSVHSNIKKLGKIAVVSVAAAGAALAGLGAGIAKLAIDAEPLVGLQQGFNAVTAEMGVSADFMLSKLQEASGGLVANRDLMQSFNMASALVSRDFAATLPDSMSLLRRASQATGQDLNFLLDSLVKGVGRVSPMILDNLGIQVSLAEVTDRAAQMFGKEASELSKLEQQTALNQIVLEKLNEAYGNVPDVTPMWGRIKTTLANLKDEIGLALLPAFQSLGETFLGLADKALPKIMEVIDKLTPYLEGISTSIGLFFDRMGGGMPLVENLGALLTNLGITFGLSSTDARALGDTFVEVVGHIQDFITRIGELLGPVITAASNFVTLKDVLIGLGIAILSAVVPAVWGLLTALAPILLTGAALIAGVALIRTAWEENWGGIRDKVQAVINFIVPFVENAIASIKEWWAQNGDAILAKVSETWESIKAAVSNAIETAKEIVGRILGIIKSNWEEHGEGIKTAASNAWEAVRSAVDSAINRVSEIISSVAGAIAGFWSEHTAELEGLTTAVWDAIEQYVDGAMQSLRDILNTFAALFTGDWEGFGEGIAAYWTGIWETITGVLETLWDGISPLLEAFWTEISGWFSSIDWGSLGKKILDGILGALSGLGAAILGTVRGAASGLGISLPFASGTAFAPGGMALVGEKGPELVYLPRGSRVVNAFDTERRLGSGGGDTYNYYTVNANYAYQDERSVRDDLRVLELLRK